jgi:hypothetical protein
MEQSFSCYEKTIRHQFDLICKLAIRGEMVEYIRHMNFQQKYELMLSELSEKELSKLFIMDEYNVEHYYFQVL